MKTTCTIDLVDETISLDFGTNPKRLIIDFVISDKKDQYTNINNFKFGYQLQVNGQDILEHAWPPEGVSIRSLHKGIFTSADIDLKIQTDYRLLVWFEFNNGKRFTDFVAFNSGMPDKPYDSMVWNEEAEEWVMLKPYPKDGKIYNWNEEALEWQEHTFEENGKTYRWNSESLEWEEVKKNNG